METAASILTIMLVIAAIVFAAGLFLFRWVGKLPSEPMYDEYDIAEEYRRRDEFEKRMANERGAGGFEEW